MILQPLHPCVFLWHFPTDLSKYELFWNREKLAVGYWLCIASCSGIIISNVTHCTFTWLYTVFNYWADNQVYSKTSYFHVLRIYRPFPPAKSELLNRFSPLSFSTVSLIITGSMLAKLGQVLCDRKVMGSILIHASMLHPWARCFTLNWFTRTALSNIEIQHLIYIK